MILKQKVTLLLHLDDSLQEITDMLMDMSRKLKSRQKANAGGRGVASSAVARWRSPAALPSWKASPIRAATSSGRAGPSPPSGRKTTCPEGAMASVTTGMGVDPDFRDFLNRREYRKTAAASQEEGDSQKTSPLTTTP